MSTAASATEFETVQGQVGEHQSPWTSGPAIVLYAAVKLIAQLLTAPRYGFSVDEFYYLACSEPYGFSGQRGPIVNVCRGFGLGADIRKIWPALKHY